MKRTGIIGLGTVSGYYADGLCNSFLSLVSVCDLDENAPCRAVYENLPFYTDFEEMIDKEKLEFVIIATTPKSHFEIAKTCIEKGVGVICEKPAMLSMSEYDTILALAKEKGVVFRVMYHFQTAFEVLEFNRRFVPDKISEIKVMITDPYTLGGNSIAPEKQALCGAWLDSGVNALSMIKCWLAFEKVEVLSTKTERCRETNLPIYVAVTLLIDDVPVSITIDWRVRKSYKASTLIFDGEPMVLDSTNQKIVYQGEEYGGSKRERLATHYYNYFKNYKGESDEEAERKIQEALFFVNDAL